MNSKYFCFIIFHRTMEKGLFVANISVVTYTPSVVKADFLIEAFPSFMGFWTVSSKYFQENTWELWKVWKGNSKCAQGWTSCYSFVASCVIWISLNKLQVPQLSYYQRPIVGDLEVHRVLPIFFQNQFLFVCLFLWQVENWTLSILSESAETSVNQYLSGLS